jgi:hypothetical protein
MTSCCREADSRFGSARCPPWIESSFLGISSNLSSVVEKSCHVAFVPRRCSGLYHVVDRDASSFRLGTGSQANRSGPSRPRGLMSQGDIQRLGMERAWFAQLSLGRSYGEVVDIHQYVSVLDTRYSVEVTWKEGRGRRLIRETDLDSLGVVLGAERAKRRAEVLQGELERLGETAELRERTDTPVITLYASTNRGVVHSIDAETGRTNWVTTIGSPQHPTTEVGANEMYVAVLNGTTLYVLNRDDGTVAWTRVRRGHPWGRPFAERDALFRADVHRGGRGLQPGSPEPLSSGFTARRGGPRSNP